MLLLINNNVHNNGWNVLMHAIMLCTIHERDIKFKITWRDKTSLMTILSHFFILLQKNLLNGEYCQLPNSFILF